MNEYTVQGLASVGYVNFLFGLFLAYWARGSGRSGLFWLVFGWALAPIAGLVMLFMQGRDHKRPAKSSGTHETERADLLSVRKDVI